MKRGEIYRTQEKIGSDRRSAPRWQFRKGGAAPENLCE